MACPHGNTVRNERGTHEPCVGAAGILIGEERMCGQCLTEADEMDQPFTRGEAAGLKADADYYEGVTNGDAA